MRSILNAKAIKAAGGEYSIPLYTALMSWEEGKGCTSGTVSIKEAADLPEQLDQLEINSGLTLIHVSDIADKPIITDTGEVLITGLGFNSTLRDQPNKFLYSTTSYKGWKTKQPLNSEPVDYQLASRDNNNRLLFRIPSATVVPSGAITGQYYDRCNTGKIDRAIFSITFDWETLAGFDGTNKAAFKLRSYTSDVTGAAAEFSLTHVGANTGSGSVTVTASKKALEFYLEDVAGGFTEATSTNVVKITNVRINGHTDFTGTYHADDVIKHQLANFTNLSTDYSQIVAGTVVLTDEVYDDTTEPTEIMKQSAAAEDWHMGIYDTDTSDVPRYLVEAVNRTTVNYIMSQERHIELQLTGRSTFDMYNEVEVEYETETGGKRTLIRTAADAGVTDPFAASGRTRRKPISHSTNSTTIAQAIGDNFLVEHGRDRNKGQGVIRGKVHSTSKGLVPCWEIRPNDIIQISDLEVDPDSLADLSAATILNGKNILRVVSLDATDKMEATVQLDSRSDRLDFLLSERGA